MSQILLYYILSFDLTSSIPIKKAASLFQPEVYAKSFKKVSQ
jgi:hypothetical protein